MKVWILSDPGVLNEKLIETFAKRSSFQIVTPSTSNLGTNFFESSSACDVVLLDLDSCNGLQYARGVVKHLRRITTSEDFRMRCVVGLSSLMAWSGQKKDGPLFESDFYEREINPNFAEIAEAENFILKSHCASMQTAVIAKGLLYGAGEDTLRPLFYQGWTHGSKAALPLPFEGHTNKIPTIHVNDFCAVVLAKVLRFEQSLKEPSRIDSTSIERLESTIQRYCIAVDNSDSSLEDIVRAISEAMGNGDIRAMTQAESLRVLFGGDDDERYTRPVRSSQRVVVSSKMQANLQFDKKNLVMHHLLDATELTMKHASGFVANVQTCVSEYLATNKVLPVRIAVLGCPGGGKTSTAKMLCEHLSLTYFDTNSVVRNSANAFASIKLRDAHEQLRGRLFAAINNGKPKTAKKKSKKNKSADTEEEKDEEKENEFIGLDLTGPFEDHIDAALMRDLVSFLLTTNQNARNVGWVMDGCVQSCAEARDMFDSVGDLRLSPPDLVLVLDGEDSAVLGRYDKIAAAKLKARLKVYRAHSPHVPISCASDDGGVKGDDEAPPNRDENHLGGSYFENAFESVLLNVDMTAATAVKDSMLVIASVVEDLYRVSRPKYFSRTNDESLSFLRSSAQVVEDGSSSLESSKEEAKCEIANEENGGNNIACDGVNAKESKSAFTFEDECDVLIERSETFRAFLDASVLPTILDGLRVLYETQPADPIGFLGRYFLEKRCGGEGGGILDGP
eukprot:g2454.t1